MTITREGDQIVIRLSGDMNFEMVQELVEQFNSKAKTSKRKVTKEHLEAIDKLINRDMAKESREWFKKMKAEIKRKSLEEKSIKRTGINKIVKSK